MTTRDRAYGFAVVFLLASALVGWGACGGDGGGAAGGGGTDAVSGCPTGGCGGPDIRDERRDLSFYFADGELLDISTSPFPRGNVPASATEEQREAVQRVNWFRWRVGVLPLDMDEVLNDAAQAHCDCYVEHFSDYATMSAHDEQAAWGEPCTGATPSLRVKAAGGASAAVAEIIAFTANPISAVDGWMATLYHRLAIIDPATRRCGYGEVPGGASRINTMDFTIRFPVPDVTQIIVYPEDGAEDVSLSWDGLEHPQPPPPPGGYPSGPIITMTWAGGDFTTVSHHINDAFGNEIEHQFLHERNDPHLEPITPDAPHTIALYPNEPLRPATTYTVYLHVDLNGLGHDVDWSFTTGD